ncbi:tRNA lysidine(34) synthetase TilS [Geofilum sp. OHC36d9]|uniref:tRNA lysidine(34) synthetase TilS n=1 Tax=Geofilum sp. OHC36d9 TaxID=3458413 RepID=UPI004033B8ED
MSKQFIYHFRDALQLQCRITEKSRIMVALSGGADSVALLHLLKNAGHTCIAAHCNFNLRDAESNEDEAFVTALCQQLNIKLHTISFQTREVAQQRKISIEMAARDLRYQWFEELSNQLNIQYIATGHHGDDAIETFFLNLTRGTGLKGLTGIAWRKGKLIRPLLYASAEEIKQYCRANNLNYRTDSTNSDTTILRNKIRHQIMPLFKEMNPSFFVTMQKNISYLEEACELMTIESKKFQNESIAKEEDTVIIPIQLLKQHPQKQTIAFDILKDYGFSGAQISPIIKSMETIPGKQFLSASHRLVVDRYNLIITPIRPKDETHYVINSDDQTISNPIHLSLTKFQKTNEFKFSKRPDVVHLDADLIDFPLYLRHAESGDRFIPLGMKNFKKLSDFFVDEKCSLIEKENCWLLINGEDIVWVVGRRIDNRYKITPKTKTIIEIKIKTEL